GGDATLNINVFFFHGLVPVYRIGWQPQHPTDRRTGRCRIKRWGPVHPNPAVKSQTRLVAISTAAVFTTATTTAGRALFARLGDVDREGASAQLRAVQRRNGLLRLFGCAHGDEAKTARTAGDPVRHQVGFNDGAVRRKGVLQVVFSGFEGKISYKQFITHVMFYCPTNFAFHRLFPNAGSKIITEPGSLEDSPC